MEQPRILPLVTEDNAYFWTSGQHGELHILRCRSCGYYIHEYSPLCPRCRGREIAPEAVSGRAVVASFTINHQPWLPGMQVPYVYAIVELAEQEGLRLTTNIVNCDPSEVAIGDPVSVAFQHYDDVWLPVFERVGP